MNDIANFKLESREFQDIIIEMLKICQAKCRLAVDYPEQLTLAIADLLPQWNSDDRLILMRTYAGAFRGGAQTQKLESGQDWEAMSAVEQGQYLVAIADFVLTELNNAETAKED